MSVPPRILHLNTAKTWRGGERQVFYLADELRRRDIAQVIVGRPRSELGERSVAAGLPFEAVSMGGEWDLFAVAKLRRICREHSINLIHAHTSRAHGLGLMAVRGLAGVRLVVSRRVDFPASVNYLSQRKYLSKRVAAYIAISENVRRILIQDGVPADRIRIVYSGVDTERFAAGPAADERVAQLRTELGLDPDTLVSGNVAALEEHKDQRTLLNALALLNTSVPELAQKTRTILLGEGKLRDALEAQARQSGLLQSGLVSFAGFRANIDEFYRLMHVFVLSSVEEGLGTAVLDAMAAGLPVAATAAGGIPEMIDHEQGGLLSAPGDAQTLARHLQTLLEDAQLRERCGAYNRKRVRRFSKSATCEDTLKVYTEVLADAPADSLSEASG